MSERGGQIVMGLLFMGAGVLPVLAALGVEPLAEGMNAPPWVVGLAGALFIAAGATVTLQALGAAAIWGQILVGFIVAGMAGVANWVAFGDGARECTSSLSLPFLQLDTGIPDCRIAFGYGALFMDAILLLFISSQLKQAEDLQGWAQGVERIAIGLIVILLLPLFLLLIPILLLKGGRSVFDRLLARLRRRP